MRFLLLFAIIITLSACNTERNNQREIISGMELAVVKNTNDQFLRPLIANYIQYNNEFKEDEMAPIYLYRCAVLYYRLRNHAEASKHLESIIRDYTETSIIEDAYLFLAMIQASPQGRVSRAKELYTEYLQKFPQGKGVSEANYFFRPKEEKLQDLIDKKLKEINSLPRGTPPSEILLQQLMFTYADFVKSTPKNPLSPTYCLQGARLAIRLEEHLIAIQFLDKIHRDYPNFVQYPDALLMLAVEYDTNITLYLHKNKVVSSPLKEHITAAKLKNMDVIEQGGKLYKEILEQFPNHNVAQSAQSGLKNLGVKTEVVVNQFVHLQDSIQKTLGSPQ